MLKNLLIRNYALIQQLEMAPNANLNIITGETGAGKSIMLGALGLLLGNRADTKALYNEGEKCVIEGVFDISAYQLKFLFEEEDLDYDTETMLRREISPSGKSRAFINDTPVNLDTLRNISRRLMDIHSQHDTLLMGNTNFQLEVIDIYSGTASNLASFQLAFRDYKKAASAYQKLLEESQEMQKALDFNQHLLAELDKANLEELDQEALEEEVEKLENAESIKENLNAALEYLNRAEFSVENGLKSAANVLAQIVKFSSKFAGFKERISSMQIELNDLSLEIETEESDLFLDQERTELLKDKLNLLYTLQKKHKVDSVNDLILIRDDLQDKVDKVLNLDDALETAKQKRNTLNAEMLKIGTALSEKRRATVSEIENSITDLLHQLGMPNAKVEIVHEPTAPSLFGIDSFTFMFSANKGIALQELKNVASGGEFSRLMLAIKYILASKTSLPTIIFDEIDTGISGEIALKVGNILKEMAAAHQVIAISHLPQIAAKGAAHYFVYKDEQSSKSVSKLRKLSEEERVKEIAMMIGGANPSEIAFANAKELMDID